MVQEEFLQLIAEVPTVSAVPNGGSVKVTVPGPDLTLHVAPDKVVGARVIDGPFGEPALTMLLDLGGEPVQLIIAPNDVAFSPDPSDTGLDLGMQVGVEDMPPIVGYTEMMRGLETAADRLQNEQNFDSVMASLAMLRYFIAGAERVGLDCTQAMKMWVDLKEAHWS